MSWLKKYLNYAGLALLVASLVLLIWPQYGKVALILAISGLVLLIVYLLLNLSSLKESLQRRSFIYSGNLLLIIILVLGLLIIVNYFLARHHYRVDFTSAKIHSL
ncbi:MAG TPA: hypothetical protein PKX32_05475, partial [Candidatus Saccharicenans sp.]|nr:hypothetical protein [Candidatus Saccharicenans sp.]